MEGGQRNTYLRLTRALSGPRVSVAKTYRDGKKTKMNTSARSQWPSSAVEYVMGNIIASHLAGPDSIPSLVSFPGVFPQL